VKTTVASKPWLSVDLNEMVDWDVYLLARTDTEPDINGAPVQLAAGMEICIFDHDEDEQGHLCLLVADAVVEPNTIEGDGWGNRHYVKWCCRTDRESFRHEAGHGSTFFLALEARLYRPEVRADARALMRLLDEDFFEIGASGAVWTRGEVIEALRGETFAPRPCHASCRSALHCDARNDQKDCR
jgi:hypothetical protein